MTQQAPSNPLPAILLRARDGLILHQTLYVAAKLGVAESRGGVAFRRRTRPGVGGQ